MVISFHGSSIILQPSYGDTEYLCGKELCNYQSAYASLAIPDLNQSYPLPVQTNGEVKQVAMKYNITSGGTLSNMYIDKANKSLILAISSPSTDGVIAIQIPRDVLDSRAGAPDELEDRSNWCTNVTSTSSDCEFGEYDDQDFLITATKYGEPQDAPIVIQSNIISISEVDARTLVFEYPKGETVTISIQGTYAIPEFDSALLIGTGGLSAVMAGIVVMRRYRIERA